MELASDDCCENFKKILWGCFFATPCVARNSTNTEREDHGDTKREREHNN